MHSNISCHDDISESRQKIYLPSGWRRGNDPSGSLRPRRLALRSGWLAHLVEVVEDPDAGLVTAALPLLPVVWLRLPDGPGPAPLAVSAPPGYKSYSQSQCCNPDLGDGILLPVPAQYQPFSMAGCRSSLSHPLLTSVGHQTSVKLFLPEVALPPPGPDVRHVLLPQHALHPVILRPGLDADGVHAELPSQK